MGHMRCGSTLLLHLLLTSPEVIGCGERNAVYRTDEGLDKLEVAARIGQRVPFRRALYAVDQINHDKFTPNVDLLRDGRVRCVFLIREPRASIESIVDLTRTYYDPWTTQRAVDYYSRRLETLGDLATSLGAELPALALTYDNLIADTSSSLRQLESFLKLDTELREEYRLQRFTGRRGDPSETIRAGRIVRDSTDEPVVVIPDHELDRAQNAYGACLASIDQYREP